MSKFRKEIDKKIQKTMGDPSGTMYTSYIN